MNMSKWITGLSLTLSLLTLNAFALDLNQSIGPQFTVIPQSFADDGNLGNMCNGRAQDSQNNANAFQQKNKVFIAINDQVVTNVIPGQIDPNALAQCKASCDSALVSCETSVGSSVPGCYTDPNGNFVCPITQIANSGACQQFSSCGQSQGGCYQSCQAQAQSPGSVSHQCQISVQVSQGFALVKTTMNGHSGDCQVKIKADKLAGNQIYSDSVWQNNTCWGEEIQVIKQ
jgi:hypothetical protein